MHDRGLVARRNPFRRYWRWLLAEDVDCRGGLALKAAYQRIVSSVYVLVSLGAAAVLLSIGSDEPAVVIAGIRRPVTIADMGVREASQAVDSVRGAVTNVPPISLRPGLQRFRATGPTDPMTSPAPVISPIYASVSDVPYFPDAPISYSPVEGDEYAVIVPTDADFVPARSFEDRQYETVSRDVLWIYKHEPQVPLNLDAIGRKGYVEVLLLIDEYGKHADFSAHRVDSIGTHPECVVDVLTSNGDTSSLEFYVAPANNTLRYVTLREEPRGLGFAECVQAVLPQNVFSPAIHDNNPVASFVRLGFYFTTEAECLMIELNSPQM